MILIDTHIFVWWTSNPEKLQQPHAELLGLHDQPVALSIISCWEIAKLVQHGRLEIDRPVLEWLNSSLRLHNIELLPLTPEIAVESTRLPDPFHRDPADQIIVATTRVHALPLMTQDSRIREYRHVSVL